MISQITFLYFQIDTASYDRYTDYLNKKNLSDSHLTIDSDFETLSHIVKRDIHSESTVSAVPSSLLTPTPKDDIQTLLSCGPTNCTRVICSIQNLPAEQNIVVKVRSRLWVDTIEKVSGFPFHFYLFFDILSW